MWQDDIGNFGIYIERVIFHLSLIKEDITSELKTAIFSLSVAISGLELTFH